MEKKLKNNEDFQIDMSDMLELDTKVPVNNTPVNPTFARQPKISQEFKEDELVNCLTNKLVTVKFIPRQGAINDPKHVMYGGLSEMSTITITVPKLRTGVFKNILTDAEKDYLEYIMGLERGSLNVYNKTNNFWDNNTEGGISKVRLTKYDTILDLSNPIDYIKYKILLANKDLVAPNLQTLQDKPKATYQYVLISDEIINTAAKAKMTTKMQCYVEYGKIENNPDVLRKVIETLTGKPVANNTKIDFLQTKAGELIEADAKMFLNVVKDPLLANKVLIQKCIEASLISKRGNYLYLRSDNTPLCEGGEEPVLSVAAKYLNSPKRQELKLSLEAKLKL